MVSNWEPARNLVEDAVSETEIAPFWLWLLPTCLPASLPPARDGPVHSQLSLLWYLLSPLFYEQAWQCLAAAAKSLQSCPTLCDPIDGSPPGSSIHGICQARILEWGAIACLRLGLFTGKFSLSLSFFFLSLVIPQFGLLSHLSSLRLSSGHSGPVLTLSNAIRASLFNPPTCWWQMRMLGVAIRHVIYGFHLFVYFSSRLCCPRRFQNSPQTHQ